jgi:hypothetical protein
VTGITLHENRTFIHNLDLILSNVSQTAALTTNPAATAASPNELAQVGAGAVA